MKEEINFHDSALITIVKYLPDSQHGVKRRYFSLNICNNTRTL